MKKCGCCDNCLEQKSIHLTNEDFNKISEKILTNLNGTPKEIQHLLNSLNGLKKEKIWKVLDYLQSEGKVRVNEQGLLERK